MILVKQDQAVFCNERPEKRKLSQVANVNCQQLNRTVHVTPRFWTSEGRVKPKKIKQWIAELLLSNQLATQENMRLSFSPTRMQVTIPETSLDWFLYVSL